MMRPLMSDWSVCTLSPRRPVERCYVENAPFSTIAKHIGRMVVQMFISTPLNHPVGCTNVSSGCNVPYSNSRITQSKGWWLGKRRPYLLQTGTAH